MSIHSFNGDSGDNSLSEEIISSGSSLSEEVDKDFIYFDKAPPADTVLVYTSEVYDSTKRQLLKRVQSVVNGLISCLTEKFYHDVQLNYWFLAGGFASYICGKTTEFDDIDLFIVVDDPRYVSSALNIEISGWIFDVFIVCPQRETFEYNVVLNVLHLFDMDICRTAIIGDGQMCVNVLATSVPLGIYDDVESYLRRKTKYQRRTNLDYNWQKAKCSRYPVHIVIDNMFGRQRMYTKGNVCSPFSSEYLEMACKSYQSE